MLGVDIVITVSSEIVALNKLLLIAVKTASSIARTSLSITRFPCPCNFASAALIIIAITSFSYVSGFAESAACATVSCALP